MKKSIVIISMLLLVGCGGGGGSSAGAIGNSGTSTNSIPAGGIVNAPANTKH